MAKVYTKDDRIWMTIQEVKPIPCPDGMMDVDPKKAHAKCPTCEGLGFVAGEKTGEVSFGFQPMDYKNKMQILAFTRIENGQEITDQLRQSEACVRRTLKELKGVYKADGSPYQLAFEDDTKAVLTEECYSDLMNITQSPELIAGAMGFLAGIPTGISGRRRLGSVTFSFPGGNSPN